MLKLGRYPPEKIQSSHLKEKVNNAIAHQIEASALPPSPLVQC